MRNGLVVIATVLAWLAPGSRASAEVQLRLANGRVWLRATNATVGEILDEWARVGQTRIVNAEQLSGSPVTLELENVREVDALETVLRSASGYLATPRLTQADNLSHFDRIVIVPTSTPVAAMPVAPPARSDGATEQSFEPNGFPDWVPVPR